MFNISRLIWDCTFLYWIEKFNIADVAKSHDPETISVSSWSLMSGNCEPRESSTATGENSIVAGSISNLNGNVRWHLVLSVISLCVHILVAVSTGFWISSMICKSCRKVVCFKFGKLSVLSVCVHWYVTITNGCFQCNITWALKPSEAQWFKFPWLPRMEGF